MRKFLRWEVTVEIEIPDEHVPDIIGRTQTDDWRRDLYTLTEDQAWEMIARCAEFDSKVHELDGWADVDEEVSAEIFASQHNAAWELLDIETVEPVTR